MHAPSIELLIEQFASLPGIGKKSAERIAFHILGSMTEQDVAAMTDAIKSAKQSVMLCPICQNLTDTAPCPICSSPKRDKTTICVVEGPKDVAAIENTGEYTGVYHVLHGTLSPMEGITPDDLKIKELLERIDEQTGEVIMATNPTVGGTATAVYIQRLLAPMGINVTRIAHGIPVGGGVEFTDNVTLIKALEGRTKM